MSDSVQPHRWQPPRLLHPWDSPGKSTGVGCHCLLQCMKVKSESEVTQSCPTLSDPMDCSPPGSSVHGIFQARVLKWGAIAFSVCSQKWCQIAKANLRERNKAGGINLPDFRLYYKSTVIKKQNKTVLVQKQAHYQWNRIGSPQVNPHSYSQLIYNEIGKRRKDSLFNMWSWENWTSTCKRTRWENSLTSFTKINSEWIKDLSV